MSKRASLVRKIDSFGRITIPMEYRKTLGIENYERVEFETIPTEEGLLIKPYSHIEKCMCCQGDGENLVEVGGNQAVQ